MALDAGLLGKEPHGDPIEDIYQTWTGGVRLETKQESSGRC
jgi:hypothetical protein